MAVTDPVGPIEVDLTADLMDPGKAPRRSSRRMLIWYRLRATPRFWIGAIVVVGMIIWAIIGLRLTQWSPTDQDLINASTGPSELRAVCMNRIRFSPTPFARKVRIWSLCIVVSRLLRKTRATATAGVRARQNAGRIRW